MIAADQSPISSAPCSSIIFERFVLDRLSNQHSCHHAKINFGTKQRTSFLVAYFNLEVGRVKSSYGSAPIPESNNRVITPVLFID